MTLRVLKFREPNDPVGIIAEFENAININTEHYPLITFISSDRKFVVTMIVPSDCYISIERGHTSN